MFDRLIGNLSVKHSILHMLGRQRVPPSVLLTGPEGIGKKQFAIEIARAIMCGDAADAGGCGTCSICTRIGSFTMPAEDNRDAYKRVIFSDHPDVGIVAASGRNILVDAIRHLESEANFRPYESSARFFVIDDADRMNEAASNALLKTLEEPPPGVHLVLVTSRPDTLLPTIRSRCQIIRFGPVDTDEIEQFLIAEKAFSHDEARLAAKMAGGSVSKAIAADIAKLRDTREKLLGVIRSAMDGDAARLLMLSESMTDAKNKDDLEQNLEVFEALLFDIWRMRSTGDPNHIRNTDLVNEISQFSANGQARHIEDWLRGIAEFREGMNVNINKRVALDALFVGMTRRD